MPTLAWACRPTFSVCRTAGGQPRRCGRSFELPALRRLVSYESPEPSAGSKLVSVTRIRGETHGPLGRTGHHRGRRLFVVGPDAVFKFRIRQRLPRYRERGRDGHLHPHAQADLCRGLVGLLESARRALVIRRGRLQHCRLVAGGIGAPFRFRRGFRDDFRPAHLRHYLERRHVVPGLARLQLPHHDRRDHGRGRGQCDDGGKWLDGGHQLAQGRGSGAALLVSPWSALLARDLCC